MSNNSLSVVILFSGEKSVLDAIESVGFANEVIVIHDCLSGEGNITTLETYKGKVKMFHKNLSSFSEQRNFGLEKAQSEWVLYVDSDEVISSALSKKIIGKISKGKEDGYMIRRVDDFLGKILSKGELLNIYLLRLAKKNKGKWSGLVHEEWKIKGRIGKINDPIMHYPHPTLFEFISEIDRYTTLRSSELKRDRVNTNSFSIVCYPLGKFILNYFIKFGFLEGNRGFVLSMMMSLHSFLVRSKLYQSAHNSK